jgi:TolB-like protein
LLAVAQGRVRAPGLLGCAREHSKPGGARHAAGRRLGLRRSRRWVILAASHGTRIEPLNKTSGPEPVPQAGLGAVFLSYASQDAESAGRICAALRAAGIEVWFDQSELRGGDVWDQRIRRELRDCALFMPIISASTQSRTEGYFRLEWHLADQRTHLMAKSRPFLVPVCVDGTRESDAEVPESFAAVQWTRLPGGETTSAFVARVARLLSPADAAPVQTRSPPVTTPVSSSSDSRSRRWRWPVAVAAAGLAIAVASVVATRMLREERPAPPAAPTVPVQAQAREKSIAVLPFVDMSEKHDQEYFSDGLSEQLLDLLAKTQGLEVIARTSSFYFKGKQATIDEIAKTLHVSYVLEGSVRKAGGTIRVTTQLVRARDGVHVWSDSYDRALKDVFKVQDEIAAAVVAALKLQLLPAPAVAGAQRTTSTEAYTQYLLAKQFSKRDTVDGYQRAVDTYHKALALDPRYVAAWAGLAFSEFSLAEFTDFGAGFKRALDAADKAIAIAPDAADGYAVRGYIRNEYVFDFVGADQDLAHAVALNPGDAFVHHLYASMLWTTGRTAQAEREFRRAIALDPLSGESWRALGMLMAFVQRLPEAREAIAHSLDTNPDSSFSYTVLADIELMDGRPQKALELAAKVQIDGLRLCLVAMANHSLGRAKESEAARRELEDKHAADAAYQVAEVYAWRGEKTKALAWLERAYAQHDGGLEAVLWDPDLANVRQEPEFRALLHKMKLPL